MNTDKVFFKCCHRLGRRTSVLNAHATITLLTVETPAGCHGHSGINAQPHVGKVRLCMSNYRL